MKKSMFKRFITLIMSMVLCFSVSACKKKGSETENPDDSGIGGNDIDFEDGTHDFDIQATGYFIVENGETQYKIVVPADATSREMTAASELSNMFEKATGIVLPFVTDNTVTYSADARYLSVGGTSLLTEAGVTVDANVLRRTGVRIVTQGKTVFMAGADDYGTLNSVYEFLYQAFNYECFSENIIRINTDVYNVPLMKYDITDVPDFQFNVASHYYIRKNTELRNRFRMVELQEQTVSQKTDGNIYHNTMDWLPYETHGATHPNWYSTITSPYRNLCYNARGDASELELLKEQVVELMKARITAEPTKEYIAFNHMDTMNLCTCAACEADRAKYMLEQNLYGSNISAAGYTASVIRFLNDVRARLQVWFDGEGSEYDHGQKILFFAYHATNIAPVAASSKDTVIRDTEGNAKPFADDVVCRGIVPWFAETNADYTRSFVDPASLSQTKAIAQNLKDWSALTDEILFWTYGTNFSHYLVPYPSFSAFQDTYKFAAQQGVKALYAQHQTNNDMSTAWERLKGYLNYKLGWNVNADVVQLTADFMEAYYGPAGKIFAEIFEEYLLVGEEQKENGHMVVRSEFHNILQEKYWPRNLLVKWIDGMNLALELIEPLKNTDPERYNAYYFNITLETVSPMYILTTLYGNTLSGGGLTDYRLKVKEYAVNTGINRQTEQTLISSLWSAWSI